eukprot:scaffold144062_cov43-Prasinocladus_malaysianus.AAC.1
MAIDIYAGRRHFPVSMPWGKMKEGLSSKTKQANRGAWRIWDLADARIALEYEYIAGQTASA